MDYECALKPFSFILFQFENLGRDIKTIFNNIFGVKLDEVFNFNRGNGRGMKDKTLNYLNQLKKDQKKKFFEVYKRDFEMFEYYLDQREME